jgi:hypothetical protein
MRHPGNSLVCLSMAVMVATCGLTGCDGEGSNPNDVTVVVTDEMGILRRVRSASELDALLNGDWPAASPRLVSGSSIDTALEAELLDAWPLDIAQRRGAL